jgi:CheY-like chemotaxis protein/tetratricopeptide (TPR) repeat protein
MELEGQLIQQIDDAALSCNERAWMRCDLAKRLEDAGSYDAARDVMGDLWQQLGERPQTEGLDEHATAEVLLRVGVLTGWIGSARQMKDAQERAKDLIGESVRLFETLHERVKAAEALTDLAYCYWREGAFDEARVMLRDALSRLTDQDSYQKGVALVRSAIVEKEATRYHEAFRILTENAGIFQAVSSDALKGKFHNELATVLKNLGVAEHREDYIDRALIEYAAASFHFEQAGHSRYCACVENNLGFLFSMVGKFAEAHEHLEHARRLFVNLHDGVHIAQVDETRARTLLAEGRNAGAERLARMAVDALQKSDHQHLLAEALTTHGTALARLSRRQQARSTLQHAVAIAEQVGDAEGAGQAILTLIEELSDLFPAREVIDLYERAAELLSTSQLPSIPRRLNECMRLVLRAVRPQLQRGSESHREFRVAADWRNFHFWTEVERYEAYLIERALKDAGGSVTRAAQLLGFPHHESLNALLKSRHQDLLSLRTPVESRRQSIIPSERRRRHRPAETRTVRILHAEDDPHVAEMAKVALEEIGWAVETCASGAEAMRKIGSKQRYDLLILDNDLGPGASGLDIARRARRLRHRRRTPILMFSGGDVEQEAWRAGAGAFLAKPQGMNKLAAMVTRVLSKK